MYSVYILQSITKGTFYIGHTDNIDARLRNHNRTDLIEGKFTRKNGPWKLVYCETVFSTRGDAVKREKEIKSWKSHKRIESLLLNGGVPPDAGLTARL